MSEVGSRCDELHRVALHAAATRLVRSRSFDLRCGHEDCELARELDRRGHTIRRSGRFLGGLVGVVGILLLAGASRFSVEVSR